MPDAATEPAHAAGGAQPAAPVGDAQVASRAQWQLVLRRFLRHRVAVVALVVLVLLLVGAFAGSSIWHYGYDEFTDELSSPPSWKHPMGTDGPGYDTLAKVLRGAQKSVLIALIVALVSTTIGTVVGAVSGYYRGVVDGVLMRFVDLLLTVPQLAILLLLGARLRSSGGSWISVAAVLALLVWTNIARVVRGVVLSLREADFVDAARALGASNARIIFRHLLPNAAGPIIVNGTLTAALAIILETALSYLGFGVQSPDTSLGLLVSQGQQAATTRPWLFYFPGLVILVIALCINFVGDGLRDAFDPKQQRR